MKAAQVGEQDPRVSQINGYAWYEEALLDNDGDGLTNALDAYPFDFENGSGGYWDYDGDGLTQADEDLYGTSDNNPDSDDDGLTDYEELMVYYTSPTSAYGLSQARGWGDLYADSLLVSVTDTDDDGIPDAIEGFYGLNYENPADGTGDLDGDGISNLVQYQAGIALNVGTVSFDADDDGMTNAFEDYYGLNRDDASDAVGDIDNDTVLNFEEARLGLSPVLWDTRNAGNLGDLGRLMKALQYPSGGAPTNDDNNNGVADWMEDAQENSTHPYFHRAQNLDLDGDGLPDSWEHYYGSWKYSAGGLNLRIVDASLDPDDDGLTNLQEFSLGLNPLIKDTDGDGTDDGVQHGGGGNNNGGGNNSGGGSSGGGSSGGGSSGGGSSGGGGAPPPMPAVIPFTVFTSHRERQLTFSGGKNPTFDSVEEVLSGESYYDRWMKPNPSPAPPQIIVPHDGFNADADKADDNYEAVDPRDQYPPRDQFYEPWIQCSSDDPDAQYFQVHEPATTTIKNVGHPTGEYQGGRYVAVNMYQGNYQSKTDDPSSSWKLDPLLAK